jgi:hypothetical protein
LRLLGAASASAGGFTARITEAVPNKAGVLAFGHYLVALPYQGGLRYMGPPVVRVPGAILLDGAGAATRVLPIAPSDVGETRVYQFWFRDPQHPDGTRSGLTNGLKVTFVP